MKRCVLLILVFLFISSCAIWHKDKMIESEDNGIVIVNFAENSNLEQAGAKVQDVLWKYDGEVVYSVTQLDKLKKNVKTDMVTVELKRGDKIIVVEIPAGKLGVYLLPIPREHDFEGDATMIEGVGKLGWGMDMDVSFFGCLTRIEELKGDNLSYSDLLVLSGYGMRTCFFDGWCPSSPDATCGYDTGSRILKKLGYDFDYYFLEGLVNQEEYENLDYSEIDNIRKMVMESIDAGWPVMAVDLIQVPEWGIITGYQKGGKELLCRTYFDQTEGYEIARKVPWVLIRIKGKKEIEIEKLYHDLLTDALPFFEIEKFENYSNGLQALQMWILDLRDEEALSLKSPDDFHETGFTNSWIYYCLTDSRTKMGDYLEENREKFGISSEAMSTLIKLYKNEGELLQKGMQNVTGMEVQNTPETWTPEMRHNQAATLEEIKNLEIKILEILKTI
ncbi:MAG: hypothetical protein K9N06_08155 [Candidatus Cloacimonetes bacterium]|nr:hypothetical protein [Candidatus Cloacimonadota bacterium]